VAAQVVGDPEQPPARLAPARVEAFASGVPSSERLRGEIAREVRPYAPPQVAVDRVEVILEEFVEVHTRYLPGTG
jgi:hypothetical protein